MTSKTQCISWLKPGDRIILLIIALSIILSLWFKPTTQTGNRVIITLDNIPVYTLPLDNDRILRFEGTQGEMTVYIHDRKVWIGSSNCPHKICMKTGKIEEGGQMIVCLPNRVVISIEGGDDRPVDGITQ